MGISSGAGQGISSALKQSWLARSIHRTLRLMRKLCADDMPRLDHIAVFLA